MVVELKSQMSEILESLAEKLEIPQSNIDEIETSYKAVATWLDKPDSDSLVSRFHPTIYPQGSFRLGTMIKPLSDEDKYDIDLVCEMSLHPEDIDPRRLKEVVGHRLKQHVKYDTILEEKNRCWRLNYENNSNRYYLDILPAIPDPVKDNGSILISDRNLDQNWDRTKWCHSNPRGYGEWFEERMHIRLLEAKRFAAGSVLTESVEDIPTWRVKTPLQMAVQLLKRQRDEYFAEDEENKPSSIIVTTVAACAYNNEADLYDALVSIIDGMKNPDRGCISRRDGIWWVPNPVDSAENFADKWQSQPSHAERYFEWVDRLDTFFAEILDSRGLDKIGQMLCERFGKKAASVALESYGYQIKDNRDSGHLRMASVTGAIGVTGDIKVRQHTFHGEKS